MAKSDEIHGLHKIPDNVLLKLANIEIGKLKAYVEELEGKSLVKEFEALKQANSHLRRQNKKLREEKRNRK